MENACIGPQYKHADIADELELAHSSLKALMQNSCMGPLPVQ